MSRFDDLLKAKKLKPGEPDLAPAPALPKSKDPNFVRTTVYLPKQMHRDLKSATVQPGSEISELVEKSVAQYLQQLSADKNI
ncbi:MAG: hypothetical protein EAZ94_21905 [Oscillatoriales cyanobacterium]|uniref:hypothetical protein n=1 Tax=unclassified Microcoleus TaxID=2642155 RepID=UPI001E0D81C5|nr:MULTISPECIES: hypothetical protein [unclassified Microcoleus]TAE09479.1 MAG: hypothetical protein EAZ94_21905 [Oscillatoriales cyanobacterium]MCC3568790.1 hypothetical protein [Microcoleus sp. PH2017_31_RDM_U_A]MCC3580383.1 hypothetical protein [Microcoleus sp. PH2017_32_RDM_D_A]MCC3595811.1 hypothetical protein [Microcoleus sp. PH2017_26_ELK_O_A]MCC3618539.1 hypothetical protein [Microcoleus sp. PH2017_38_RDM_U_B]